MTFGDAIGAASPCHQTFGPAARVLQAGNAAVLTVMAIDDQAHIQKGERFADPSPFENRPPVPATPGPIPPLPLRKQERTSR